MEKTHARSQWQLWTLGAALAAGLLLLRRVLAALLFQLLAAGVLMLLTLPLCRALEKRMNPAWAAGLSLLTLALAAGALVLLLVPPTVRQVQQLTTALPALLDWLEVRFQDAQRFLEQRGLSLGLVKDELFSQLGAQAGRLVSTVVGAVTQAVQSLSSALLSPLLAFYLLRDRRKVGAWLTLLLPVRLRARGVRAAREMRRETASFLRGQLLSSLIVGSLTAAGLLLTGTPGWLLLGVLMGVMELIPYIGPVLAGIPAVLLSLQHGLMQAVWTTAVLFIIQQIEGTFLSPRLLSDATRLHPMTVLLAISAGGLVGGTLGMVLALPLIVSARGALRGWRE